jgi:type II secretory pathway predicted ATPase ExeA/septal ring-binding cell division protein DamX
MSKVVDTWQALGFKRKPFIDLSRTNPFLTAKQRQQLKLLEELVREGGHLLLLLGVSGVGKTTFLNTLKKNIALPSDKATIGLCEMQGDQGVTVAMIKGLLAKHLALSDNDDNFMSILRPRLAQLAQSNQRFLLIIDDAHELPAETVRFILDIVSELDEAEQSLSILLAGRLQLEHLCVNSASVNTDWNTGSSFTVILQPLREEEVINYIKHGLRQAGYRGVMPFSKAQLIELSHDSKGILARLVVMAVDILETKRRGVAAHRQIMPQLVKKLKATLWPAKEPITTHAPRNTIQRTKMDIAENRNVKEDNEKKGYKGLIASALAIALFGIGWWVYLGDPTPTAVDVSKGEVISVEKDGQWIKTVVKPAVNTTVAATPVAPVVNAEVVAPSVTPVGNTVVAATSATPIANTAVPVTSVANTTVAVAPVKDVPITTPIANDTPAIEAPVAVANAAPVVNVAPVAKSAPVATPAVAVKPQKKTDPAPVVVQKKTTPAAPFKTQGYTIQIAGSTDLTALQKTVCQLWTQQAKPHCSGLPANLHYIHTMKDNQDWYIATLGQYNSSSEAHVQLKQLPANVQKNTPWVRTFAQIPNLTVVAAK